MKTPNKIDRSAIIKSPSTHELYPEVWTARIRPHNHVAHNAHSRSRLGPTALMWLGMGAVFVSFGGTDRHGSNSWTTEKSATFAQIPVEGNQSVVLLKRLMAVGFIGHVDKWDEPPGYAIDDCLTHQMLNHGSYTNEAAERVMVTNPAF